MQQLYDQYFLCCITFIRHLYISCKYELKKGGYLGKKELIQMTLIMAPAYSGLCIKSKFSFLAQNCNARHPAFLKFSVKTGPPTIQPDLSSINPSIYRYSIIFFFICMQWQNNLNNPLYQFCFQVENFAIQRPQQSQKMLGTCSLQDCNVQMVILRLEYQFPIVDHKRLYI